jgi:integrase
MERGLSRSTVVNVIPSAVGFLFRYGVKSPIRGINDNILLQTTKATVKRMTEKTKQKLPITREQLAEMQENSSDTEKDIRDMCLLIFMFVGFLRESEAVGLGLEDVYTEVVEGEEAVIITIKRSKTDKTGETATVVLAGGPGHPLCPVMWYKKYLEKRGNVGGKLFKKVGEPGHLAATTPNYIVKAWLTRIGVDPKGYGSHSLRRGGTTEAMRNKVRTHVLKRHGRWASDAVYMYMVDDVAAKLQVSRAVLGL